MFCPPANYYRIYIHLPSPVQSQLFTLFPFLQSSERKKRTGKREDIRRNTFKLSAGNQAKIFYKMYNLAGCTVVSRNLRLRKPTLDQDLQRFTSNLEFYPSSRYPPGPRKYPPRRTRTCGARGGTCPLVTLQLEEICPAGCCKSRAWSFHSNAVIRLRGSGNTGRHICDRVYRSGRSGGILG